MSTVQDWLYLGGSNLFLADSLLFLSTLDRPKPVQTGQNQIELRGMSMRGARGGCIIL